MAGIGIAITCPLGALHSRMQISSPASKRIGYISASDPKYRAMKAVASPTVAAPKREKDPKKRIVITGMGLVPVFGTDNDNFYNNLLEGQSGIITLEKVKQMLWWLVEVGTDGTIKPCGVGGFIACRALSQRNEEPEKASRPWDKDRDGFVLGEGSAVLVEPKPDFSFSSYLLFFTQHCHAI